MKSRPLALPVVLGTFLLSACSGFVSTPTAPTAGNSQLQPVADGIYYYMTTAPIIVQVTLDDKGSKTITVPAVSAMPDRSKPYLLTVPGNLVSESHATLSVGTNGLLLGAATVQTSG